MAQTPRTSRSASPAAPAFLRVMLPSSALASEVAASTNITKLSSWNKWNEWHIKARMDLQRAGMRHLMSRDGLEDLQALDDPDAEARRMAEEDAGVTLLVERMSEEVLSRIMDHGWKPEEATVLSTMQTLSALMDRDKREHQDWIEEREAAHAHITGLARIDLAEGAKTVKEYILEAKRCHDGLLARYVDGSGSTEELLEQLFTICVVEGIKAAQPGWYADFQLETTTESGRAPVGTTRTSLTEWLLAKDRATAVSAPSAAAPLPSAPRASRPAPKPKPLPAGTAKLASKPADPPRSRPSMRCNYCIEHHPLAAYHDAKRCWFVNPHLAPSSWRKRNKADVVKVNPDRSRERSRSPSPMRRRPLSTTGLDERATFRDRQPPAGPRR